MLWAKLELGALQLCLYRLLPPNSSPAGLNVFKAHIPGITSNIGRLYAAPLDRRHLTERNRRPGHESIAFN